MPISPKYLLIIALITLPFFSRANMASPVESGSVSGSPFLNQHVDIVKETIKITPDSQFETCRFEIEYRVRANKEGIKIPFLFVADGFKGDFIVRINDEDIALKEIPSAYTKAAESPFEDFSYNFDSSKYGHRGDEVTIWWNENQGAVYRLSDLKYFENDLDSGQHIMHIDYISDQFIDHGGWVNEYSFQYRLSPAEHWKSFGTLEVLLDDSELSKKYITNLDEFPSVRDGGYKTWTFSELPKRVIELTYIPDISKKSDTLISLGPNGIAWIFSILLILLHLLAIILYRKSHLHKRFSWVVILGCFIIPLLVIVIYIKSYGIILDSIGSEAGGTRFGYAGMNILMYPVVMPIYLIIMLVIDWVVARVWRQKA